MLSSQVAKFGSVKVPRLLIAGVGLLFLFALVASNSSVERSAPAEDQQLECIKDCLNPGRHRDAQQIVAFEKAEELTTGNLYDNARGSQMVTAEKTYQNNLKARQPLWDNLSSIREEYKGARPYFNKDQKRTHHIALRDVFLVPVYPCPQEFHVGQWSEGGKWTCRLEWTFRQNPPIVYSIGCNGETSFEKDVFDKFGSKPLVFDPTLTPKTVDEMMKLPYMHFNDIGLSATEDATVEREMLSKHFDGPFTFMSVPQMMKKFNMSYIDIFKIDCEGCENGVMAEIFRSFGRNKVLFGQVLMEIHRLTHVPETFDLFKTMEDLGYRLFHSEQNFRSDYSYEVSYIHESLVS